MKEWDTHSAGLPFRLSNKAGNRRSDCGHEHRATKSLLVFMTGAPFPACAATMY